MPRSPRLLLSKSYYHIMTRGNNKNRVFRDDSDYRYYLEKFRKYKQELQFDLFHYCLMPTHVHQLVRTKNALEYSLFMKKINLSYFHYYNRKYGWTGHFWQDRFKSQPVGKDAYFVQCGKYIELNPVRKGLVVTPGEYQYSSYKYYSMDVKDDLITEDFIYSELDENQQTKQRKYREITIDDIIASSYTKSIWGSGDQRYNERNKKDKYFSRHNKHR